MPDPREAWMTALLAGMREAAGLSIGTQAECVSVSFEFFARSFHEGPVEKQPPSVECRVTRSTRFLAFVSGRLVDQNGRGLAAARSVMRAASSDA